MRLCRTFTKRGPNKDWMMVGGIYLKIYISKFRNNISSYCFGMWCVCVCVCGGGGGGKVFKTFQVEYTPTSMQSGRIQCGVI